MVPSASILHAIADGIVISMNRMTRIVKVDAEARIA